METATADPVRAEHSPWSRETALETLTSRELEVLVLMAEGLTNIGIARRLWLTHRTVECHVARILGKLSPHTSDDDHRRVQAVLIYLQCTSRRVGGPRLSGRGAR